MKKVLDFIICIVIIVLCGFLIYENKEKFIMLKDIVLKTHSSQNLKSNEYKKGINYEFVKIHEGDTVKNKEDIKNTLYTYLDSGWDKYTFSCDKNYSSCITDVKLVVDSNNYLTDISNYVHPFNTFNKINTQITKAGNITLEKTKRYSKEEIDKLNEKVNQIYNENYDSSKNVKENIKIFHDYIINNTKYDKTFKKDQIDYTSLSSNAYGVLFNGLGICTGYTEAMQLFLEKLNVKNYRISSSTHEWNLVYIEGKWLHLDLTWDDPLVSDGSDTITDKYFLIDTNTLKSFDDGEHEFDSETYKEANN